MFPVLYDTAAGVAMLNRARHSCMHASDDKLKVHDSQIKAAGRAGRQVLEITPPRNPSRPESPLRGLHAARARTILLNIWSSMCLHVTHHSCLAAGRNSQPRPHDHTYMMPNLAYTHRHLILKESSSSLLLDLPWPYARSPTMCTSLSLSRASMGEEE